MKILGRGPVAASLVAAVVIAVAGHHSFAAEYDNQDVQFMRAPASK